MSAPLVVEVLAALNATLTDGHYERCLHGLRGGPPDDETRIGGARCSEVCIQIRKAIRRAEEVPCAGC